MCVSRLRGPVKISEFFSKLFLCFCMYYLSCFFMFVTLVRLTLVIIKAILYTVAAGIITYTLSARFFRGKVDNIRTSTTSADLPTIAIRQVPPLGSFKPATVTEIVSLLKKAPAKSCELDPIPTWLLKDLAPLIAPTICCLCNLSMDSGVVPAQLKQARVLPLLKKPTLDPDAASSYTDLSPTFRTFLNSSNVSLLAASLNIQPLSIFC